MQQQPWVLDFYQGVFCGYFCGVVSRPSTAFIPLLLYLAVMALGGVSKLPDLEPGVGPALWAFQPEEQSSGAPGLLCVSRITLVPSLTLICCLHVWGKKMQEIFEWSKLLQKWDTQTMWNWNFHLILMYHGLVIMARYIHVNYRSGLHVKQKEIMLMATCLWTLELW